MSRATPLFLTLPAVLLPLLLAPGASRAQDELLTYSLKKAVIQGQGWPQVLLQASSDFRKLELICQRGDGSELKLSSGSISRGGKKAFDLQQPAGALDYDCEARGYYGSSAEEYFDLAFRFEAFVGPGLKIEVPRAQIDRKARSLAAKADREIAAAHLTVVGEEGVAFDADVDVPSNQPGEEIALSWEGPYEVLRLEVTLTDKWGFYAYEKLHPWSLEIPHDDVHFDSGSDVVKAEEQPKIDRAWDAGKDVVAKYAQFVEVRLYIAGYTDTVDDRGYNQSLSEKRAAAIARAFRAKGFSGPIYYQGFGEDALRVGTGDGVDEPLNRRAVYLLASQHPDPSHDFPRAGWKKL
jgi:outer membrane protein OmpA-like peptidoglycan-associated protein